MKAFVALVCLFAIAGCDFTDKPLSKYQMVAAKGSTPQEDRAWVLDTTTGRLSLCYESAAQLKCLDQGSALVAPKK